MMTDEGQSNQKVSYKTNSGWFLTHNDVKLYGSDHKTLPKEVIDFLKDNPYEGIEVTICLTKRREC